MLLDFFFFFCFSRSSRVGFLSLSLALSLQVQGGRAGSEQLRPVLHRTNHSRWKSATCKGASCERVNVCAVGIYFSVKWLHVFVTRS